MLDERQKKLDEIFGAEKYVLMSFVNWNEKVTVKCIKHQKIYLTSPKSLFHQKISGCPNCRSENLSTSFRLAFKKGERKWNGTMPPIHFTNTEEIIRRFKNKHGEKYDYSKVAYVDSQTPVEIICPIHGSFWQKHTNHYRSGCKKCAIEKANEQTRDDKASFIEKCLLKKDGKYDYSKVAYVDSQTPVEIICPIHGSFWQRPYNHLNGTDCPKCSCIVSKPHQKIIEFLKSNSLIEGTDFTVNDRSLISPYEVDIYIPSKKIAIEYNGSYFHDEAHRGKNYHRNKKNLCEEKGINLINIFDYDFLEKEAIVLSRLKSLIGTSKRIFARKLSLKEVPKKESDNFLNENHLQGSCSDNYRIGLYEGDNLVALMTFGKPRFDKKYNYELIRYCTLQDTNVVGGASRLLSHFRKNKKGTIISYANRDWTSKNHNLYQSLNFKLVKETPPNYMWIHKNKLIKLSRYKTQKHKLKNILGEDFSSCKTEDENMQSNDFLKVFDSGNLVYELGEDN